MDHLDVLVLENDELRHHVTALRQLIADIIVDFEIAGQKQMADAQRYRIIYQKVI